MLARRVSFCVEARTPASRERYGHLVLLSLVSARPQMRGLPHIAENFKIEIFEARFLNCYNRQHSRHSSRSSDGCSGLAHALPLTAHLSDATQDRGLFSLWVRVVHLVCSLQLGVTCCSMDPKLGSTFKVDT